MAEPASVSPVTITLCAYCRWRMPHPEHRWDYGGYAYRCPGVVETMRLEQVNTGEDHETRRTA